MLSPRQSALPAQFRRTRILVVGCGDVGQRLVAHHTTNGKSRGIHWMALSSSAAGQQQLRALGMTVIRGDLDQPESLNRLSGLAHRVLHLAPPPTQGWGDPRTKGLLAALARRTPPRQLVYGSTSGVYGDRKGATTSETSRVNPQTPRGQRRASAEAAVRAFGQQTGASVSCLRIPGIYAPDRSGPQVRERLLKQTPVLEKACDVITNHIHADDLARACWNALWHSQPQRNYNVSDDTRLRMGDYYDLLADMNGLPRPPRVNAATAKERLPMSLLSFMGESRRMTNDRLKHELGLRLRYPTVRQGWAIQSLF